MKNLEKNIGKITHFYNKISAAVLALQEPLNLGDAIHITGKNTDFTQKVESMQIEHQPVLNAKAGDEIGLKVDQPVREGDIVYKVST